MTIKKSFFILLSCVLLIVGCGVKKEKPMVETPTNLIQKGILFGAGEEGFEQSVLAIHSIDEWHDLVKKLGQVNVFETKFDAHSFDFENNRLFFCTDKVRSTGGYSLSLSNGKTIQEKVVVEIQISSPEEMAAEVLTQPYLLFSMKKVKKTEVVFIAQ